MQFKDMFNLNAVTLNISNACNLNCSYCFEDCKDGRLMSPSLAVQALSTAYSSFKKSGTQKQFSVSFFGGEPFTNFPAIEACLKWARENEANDIVFGVTTNMTILTEHMLDVIEEHELRILASLDGLKEVHDASRDNSYDSAISNTKRLLERGLGYLLEVRMTLHPKYVHTMYDGVMHLLSMGINNVYPYFLTDVPWTSFQRLQLRSQLEKLFVFIVELYEDVGNERNISIRNLDATIEAYIADDNSNAVPCTFGGTTWVAIGVDGELQPCHQRFTTNHLRDELCLGDIVTGQVYPEMLLGAIIPNTWKSLNPYNDCETCSAASICRGWCPSEGITKRDSFLGVPSIICYFNATMVTLIEKFLPRLLTATNIRNRHLNILVLNYKLEQELQGLKKVPVSEEKFPFLLMDYYAKLQAHKDMLLPAFVKRMKEEFALLSEQLKGVN